MTEKIVEIAGLDYSYPDGTKAINDLTLDIFEGESLGIIGPNGAGKSTLLLHLNGILENNRAIKVGELEVTEKNLSAVRKIVGLVFQEPDNQLFMPTVFDDVAFGPLNMGMSKDEVNLAVEDALSKVDMLHAKSRISHHLSFGEKKRVSIATVLSMNTNILALDEPSSNLDPKHRKGLINLLGQLPMTKIIVSHDLDLVSKVCSRVIVMEYGEIVADGNKEDILNDTKLLSKHSLLFD